MDLANLVFTIDPYDPCVANEMEKFTVVWHVDGLKLSHIDPEEFTNMLSLME